MTTDAEQAIAESAGITGANIVEIVSPGRELTDEERSVITRELKSFQWTITKGILEDLLEHMNLAGYKGPFTITVEPGSVCEGRFHAHYDPAHGITGHPIIQ